ncbi:MAG: hypothetical protein AAFO04_17560 [Cyanobacteria bacterium J06592_8]
MLGTDQGKLLWKKHKELRQLFRVGEDKSEAEVAVIDGDTIIRLLFVATRELYKNLRVTMLE